MKKKIATIVKIIVGSLTVLIMLYSITLIILSTCFGFSRVVGQSMYPTFKGDNKEYVLSSAKKEPKLGDVVVIKYDGGKLIKRVIACPGDVISLKDGFIYVNDKPCPYHTEKLNREYEYLNKTGYLVEEGKYFCVGDNITNSLDSKQNGTFSRDKIRVVTKAMRFPFKLLFY